MKYKAPAPKLPSSFPKRAATLIGVPEPACTLATKMAARLRRKGQLDGHKSPLDVIDVYSDGLRSYFMLRTGTRLTLA
jgi:hypothetical protein